MSKEIMSKETSNEESTPKFVLFFLESVNANNIIFHINFQYHLHNMKIDMLSINIDLYTMKYLGEELKDADTRSRVKISIYSI